MPDKTARGRFVWHELNVPDAANAHEFYGKVVGWKTQPFAEDPTYQMFAANTGPLGGTVVDAQNPPHWLPYIGTTDIEATVLQAVELGGTVVTAIAPIPNGGRWARLSDPQGAAFAVHQSPVRPGREKPPKRGEFSWHELMTTDYKAAFEFYSALFGWEKTSEADMGPELGVYFMFGRNGVPLGGMFDSTPQMQGGPAWTGYIRVKDVNKAVKKAKAAGATLINGPMEVPGGDWIAQFVDPQGAMFAVHALQADIAPKADTTTSAAPTPQQGTLDFPPADSVGPETVSVAAQKPAAKKSAKEPAAAAETKQSTAKQAPAKSAKKPPSRKTTSKKTGSKKARVPQKSAKKAPARKKVATSKARSKAARKAPAKSAKKAARPTAKKKAVKKARRAK